jgi:Tfp pilus assembly protein PilN
LDGETTVELLTREKIQLEDRLHELQQLFAGETSASSSSSSANLSLSSDRKMDSLLSSWNEAKISISQLQIEISFLHSRISVLKEEYQDVRSLDELKSDWNEYEKEMQSLFQQTRKQFEKEKILIKSEKEKILAERTHLDEKVSHEGKRERGR